MSTKFKLGDRVRMTYDAAWGEGATGTISNASEGWHVIVAGTKTTESWHRIVKGRRGPIDFYWVIFDEPQLDADGDGPYAGAEIEEEWLEFE